MIQERIDGLYWWQILPAIPQERDSRSYKRLERMWRDTSRFGGNEEENSRLHDLFESHYETHLTCTLFENFSLFEPYSWINPFFEASGFQVLEDEIIDAAWSYEWETNYIKNGKRETRFPDVMISYLCRNGDKGAIVVEAKALGKRPEPFSKDFNLGYYFENPHLDRYRKNLRLIYLVDSKVKDFFEKHKPEQAGLMTWQDLGALQIRLTIQMDIEPRVKHFLAGAIQYHYLCHKITPSELCAEYLREEPSLREIHDAEKLDRQTPDDRKIPYWEFDWKP